MKHLALYIATCGYVGHVPVAPGTFGSAAGLVLLWALRALGSSALEIAFVVVLLALGVWSATIAERSSGRVDPGIVVIDEVVGMIVTMMFIPASTFSIVAGFLVFRVLDILKPWPTRRLERLPGGAGIMADDVMAAVYGNVVMHGMWAVVPAWFI